MLKYYEFYVKASDFYRDSFTLTYSEIWSIEKAQALGSFCGYQGTEYVTQKKQYNHTMKSSGEAHCLVPLIH